MHDAPSPSAPRPLAAGPALGQTDPPVRPQPSAGPLPSDTLLRGRKTIEISHNGAVYRLQATRQGKLILTK